MNFKDLSPKEVQLATKRNLTTDRDNKNISL